MRISVLYFAVFRERIGKTKETVELPAGSTVGALLAQLGDTHESVKKLAGRFRVAVNQDLVEDAHPLADGDEVALIPPVAGGSGAPHVQLLDEPLSLDRCVAAVRSPEMGAVVTFAGIVRIHNRGTTITRLEYEAYAPMATKVMTDLIAEIRAEVPSAELAVEHRVGVLAVGDVAVVIAAAAPHRAEAFAACRAMIDRLKERVPIWKKELGASGEEWIGLGP